MANGDESKDGLSVAESFVVRATDATVELTTELLSGSDPSSALAKAAAKFGISITLDAGLAFARGRARAATDRLQGAAAIEATDGLAMLEEQVRKALNESAKEDRLRAILQDHQFWRLQRNYEFEWMREPMDERRRMLEFAAAGAVNVALSPGELARVERALRELDPTDIKLLEAVESVELPLFEPSKPEESRWERAQALADARTELVKAKEASGAALITSGCLRSGQAFSGPFTTGDECSPTTLGRQVLAVLDGYLRARKDDQ